MSLVASADNDRAELREVAPGLYFHLDPLVSNSVVLVTADGVLVVDSRMHPDDASVVTPLQFRSIVLRFSSC